LLNIKASENVILHAFCLMMING